jgi:dienelactone hydrolase
VDVDSGTERRLTTGGTETLRNGRNDWVYYEEIFNRQWRAYWWSPDSRRIAFLQSESSEVPLWPLTADHEDPRRLEQARYPRPGEPNPKVRMGIVGVAGGNVRWVDLPEYDAGNYLISWVGWLSPKGEFGKEAPESRTAFCCVQNRTQTWLDIIGVPAQGGPPRKLLRETTDAWVEPQGDPYVLRDGSFILASERDGYRHLYLYGADGKLKNRVTEGKWEARSIAHVDEESGVVYVNATGVGDNWLGSRLYRVKLDGTEMKLLTAGPVGPIGEPPIGARADASGSHSVSFSPSGKYYIDTWSDSQTPTRVALYDSTGALVRTLDTNPVYQLEEYTRGTLEHVQIPMPDGFQLDATILKPPGFSEGNKYPVWLMTYAGPHAPTVSDTWGGGRTYDEMLANTGIGIVVFRVDPRSASGHGAVAAWSAYKQLGVQELADLGAAVKWLGEKPYIDASRVGIAGGSYGGFMTSYALTHSKVFAAGIATAAVTDWRDYDSIYTERYMLTPQENPEGYDKSSVVKGARELHGRLLLVHGTMDDNVHIVNSIKLISALQQADKQFDFMLYPGARHGVGGDHARDMNYNFIRAQLLGEGPVATSTGDAGQGDRPRRRPQRRGAGD